MDKRIKYPLRGKFTGLTYRPVLLEDGSTVLECRVGTGTGQLEQWRPIVRHVSRPEELGGGFMEPVGAEWRRPFASKVNNRGWRPHVPAKGDLTADVQKLYAELFDLWNTAAVSAEPTHETITLRVRADLVDDVAARAHALVMDVCAAHGPAAAAVEL